MHALDLLDRAEQAGLRLTREGDLLHVDGPAGAASIVNELRERKADVLNAWWTWQAHRLIRQIEDRDTRQDMADLYDEVAACREYEQNQNRETAELIAFGALVAEMLWRGLPVQCSLHGSHSCGKQSSES